MNVLDLFSGIGGFSLGLERAGMRTVAFCEIDGYGRKVLKEHWPDVPCHDDIKTREFREGEADVICGGFPCQDISAAGDRTGITGERSGLWRELLRAIRVVRPIYAVVENVAALLGRGMGTVLGDLAEIGQDAEWHCIPARAVGAPHIRDRVWIVVADPARGRHGLDGLGEALKGQLDYPGADLAYADVIPARGLPERANAPQPGTPFSGEDVADANGQWELQPQGRECVERGWLGNSGQDMADAECIGCCAMVEPITCGEESERPANPPSDGSFPGWWRWWAVEPDVGRVAYGIPSRVDRLKGLGNAVVPQIPEAIGRAIMKVAFASAKGTSE